MKTNYWMCPLTIFIAVGSFTLTGCMTTTRLGDVLIPAHPCSAAEKDQQVEAYFVCDKAVKNTEDANQSRSLIAGSAAAAFIAKEGVEFLARQMEKEAERYEAQYGAISRMIIDEYIKDEAYIVLLSGNNLPKELNYSSISSGNIDSIVSNIEKDVNNKTISSLSSMIVLKMTRPRDVNVFIVEPQYIWIKKCKAKVVGFSFWPWYWLGDLFLKTGSEVKVKIETQFEGLMQLKEASKNVQPIVTSATLLNLSLPEVSVKLDENGTARRFNRHCGAWLYVPSIASKGKKGGTGFVTVRFTVTERDPSNVKKLLIDGAENLNKKAESTDWKKLFEGLSL